MKRWEFVVCTVCLVRCYSEGNRKAEGGAQLGVKVAEADRHSIFSFIIAVGNVFIT